MKNDDMNEVKSLIEVRKNIFNKIKMFLMQVFSNKKKVDITQIKTFEEQYLSKEEQEELKIKKQKYIEEAKFYKKVLENPEEFLDMDNTEEYEYDNLEEKESLLKKELLKRYENIKKGTANIEDLSTVDLLKIEALLKEEISIKTRSVNYEKAEKELKELEEENRNLMEELKKLENESE